MRENEKKALAYLGLAARAGRVTVGVPLCCEALKKRTGSKKITPVVVLFAADASAATKKRIVDRTAYYGVTAIELSLDCGALAGAVGKQDGSVAAVLVSEPNLARAISALYQKEEQ
ncbi:MAG: hypothetical protein IJC99_06160 [Clostridia bacterium]|nr:hypothetical protein [Clostridia bacterium]